MTKEWENPFSIGTNENNETVIRLGGQLASKKTFDNIEEAKQYIESKPWDLLAILSIAMAETTFRAIYESKKETKEKEK
jgi:hypothetical protein